LGDSPYLVFNKSIVGVKSPSDYTMAIEKLLRSEDLSKDEIIFFIDCCLSKSFNMDSGLIWRGDYDSFGKEEKIMAIKNIYKSIDKIYKRKVFN